MEHKNCTFAENIESKELLFVSDEYKMKHRLNFISWRIIALYKVNDLLILTQFSSSSMDH